MLRSSKTEMTFLTTPDMSNFGGNMHGGELLKLLDKVAYTCAMRYCGKYVVTLSVDQVLFKQAIKIGELVYLKASVNYTGSTSMEVGIQVTAENLEEASVRHTNSCYFTMVAVDKGGKPTLIEPLQPETEQDKKRWQAAQQRRAQRQKKPAQSS